MSSSQESERDESGVMPQIKTVVMLMLENRSLDSVLGWLYENDTPHHVYPPESDSNFDGIPNAIANGQAQNATDGKTYRPQNGTAGLRQSLRQPRWDPHEGMGDVKVQLYGGIDGSITDNPWGPDAPMSGFAFDHEKWHSSLIQRSAVVGEVMGAYNKEQLPVLYGLAENFAVSDRWFSSVPTMTDPNRAFSLCGTSLGSTDDFKFYYDAPTIFNALAEKKTWGIYWQYHGLLSFDPGPWDRRCYTVDKFRRIDDALDDNHFVAHYDEFFYQLEAGTLPEFCYIEPFWGAGLGHDDGEDFIGVQGNDYHSPTWVGPAEHSLNELYKALRCSKQWDEMLFIITFDEHGGTWDHVPPPEAAGAQAQRVAHGFDFTRLGVRVPTILVSPFVAPGTVFRSPDPEYDFDHGSTLRTLLAWAGVDETVLGSRVSEAPMFDRVLGTEIHDHPRSFEVPAGYASQGGGLGLHGMPFPLHLSIDQIRLALHNFGELTHDVEDGLRHVHFLDYLKEFVAKLHPR